MKYFLIRSTISMTMAALAMQAQAQNGALKSVQLTAGTQLIQAEVAATEEQREQGLMYREKMERHAGMLFVFDRVAPQCMWMKNTALPLSVAFLDAGGRIINIEDMQPHTYDSHCSTRGVPARYALEMQLGWFRVHQVKPGMVVGKLPR